MLLRSSLPGPQADTGIDERQLVPASQCLGASPGVAAAYAVFCHQHWLVYQRYASAVTGSAATGRRLARTALRELGAQWPTALRSTAPSALAWALLSATTASSRSSTTVRTLQRSLDRREVDALILRYRLGLTVQQAGCAMGMTPAAFELLRCSALRKAAWLAPEGHMPESNAV